MLRARLHVMLSFVGAESSRPGGNCSSMDITGSQKVQAPQAQVFSALLNPEVLQNSVPGCESAKLVDMAGMQQLKLRITTDIPGFKGPYVVFLQTAEVIPTSRIVFLA